MKKTQLKAFATQLHGLAVKSANGKKTTQNRALEKISTLLNQAIEVEVKPTEKVAEPTEAAETAVH